MMIGGLQKTTLIDFPGTIACSLFTVGCNFRCPFCHNKDLVTLANFKKAKLQNYKEKDFFDFLQKRKKWLDGVCITGGEPTIYKELPEFILKIKKLGYKVKLDTNGSNPEVLSFLYKNKLLDYVAMDIKSSFDNYEKAINYQFSSRQPADNFQTNIKTPQAELINKIKKSIKLILQSKIDYDFRTTVVPTIHSKESLKQLAENLRDIAQTVMYMPENISYFIQPFQPQNCLRKEFLKITPFSKKELKDMLKLVQAVLPKASIRGE